MPADASGPKATGPVARADASLVPDSPGIRSYAGRAGRMTPGQRRAIERLWPRFGIDDWVGLDFERAFGRRAATVVEVGFGMGDALATMAGRCQERNYVGIEVYPPGVGSALRAIEAHGLTNVRLIRSDAVAVLSALADASLEAVLVFFPDPWPKKRHHKRRLIQPRFVDLVSAKLMHGGRFELATDWSPYAQEMRQVIEAQGEFRNLAGAGGFVERPSERPLTKFELRGERLGHAIYDLVFERL
ncbi:MAG TPA: tRNA (guanosine(46)-N7)-methyltransferase TrmB [Gammaproteobacteria bacterium]